MINFEALADAPEDEVAQLCAIDLNHLETALQNHASIYGYAEAAYEMAEYAKAQSQVALDRISAQTFMRVQEEVPGLAIGKTNMEVDADERVLAAKEELLERSKRCGVLKALIRGLQHRRDMLIQISSRQKAEARQY